MSCNTPFPIYRIVQTQAERNSIPCDERMNGMIVTVVEGSTLEQGRLIRPYTRYMLQGGDACNNNNWKKLIDQDSVEESVGHVTETVAQDPPLTNDYFNNKYPNSKEGFKVTITPLNTTFMKIKGNVWVLSNSIKNG